MEMVEGRVVRPTLTNKLPLKNPPDEFGNTTTCDFCHSFYHYVNVCPDKSKVVNYTENDYEHHL